MDAPIERRHRSLTLSQYADIQVELTLTIFRKQLPTVILGCATMSCLTGLMAHATGDRNLWFFTSLMTVAGAVRILVVQAFYARPAGPLTQASAARWRMLHAVVAMSYSVCFASETFYGFLHGDIACWLLAAMGTYALCASIGSQAGAFSWVGQCCTVVMLLALDFGLLHHLGEMAIAGTILNAAFAIVHCRAIRIRFEGLADNLRTKRKLRLLAEQDTLTGLANRYCLQQSLATACQEGTAFALFFIDLDGFKRVNDTYGHAAGDILLQEVAHRLHATVRVSDLVARLGGDEFAILQTPITGEATVHALAERITQAFSQPVRLSGREIPIGASIGIHLASPADDDPNRILNTADQALYRVKRAGGGTFSFAASAS